MSEQPGRGSRTSPSAPDTAIPASLDQRCPLRPRPPAVPAPGPADERLRADSTGSPNLTHFGDLGRRSGWRSRAAWLAARAPEDPAPADAGTGEPWRGHGAGRRTVIAGGAGAGLHRARRRRRRLRRPAQPPAISAGPRATASAPCRPALAGRPASSVAGIAARDTPSVVMIKVNGGRGHRVRLPDQGRLHRHRQPRRDAGRAGAHAVAAGVLQQRQVGQGRARRPGSLLGHRRDQGRGRHATCPPCRSATRPGSRSATR